MENFVNLTPSPRILEVITHNPMPPIHALCELIDNSIDGFKVAEEKGIKIQNQLIDINLPSPIDIKNKIGKISIRDNGPGMDKETARNAVTAGYTSNNQFDRLGLFGLGFNIATGKLGSKTVLRTARREDKVIFCITIDLLEMKKSKSFSVPVQEMPKPSPEYSGTEIEITGWWPEGHQNFNFVKKLAEIGKSKLTAQIGRRYSTLLRKNLNVLVNGKESIKFHHCAWSGKRYVERRGYGQIAARHDFIVRLGSEKHCYICRAVVPSQLEQCAQCGPNGVVKTKERVINGWVGIQRYDDVNKYGIDFIRNGRAILIDEKEAVFNWTLPTGEKIKEYPVDGIYGRIIGEVNIDHVPTDFTKTDFQRTSPEWDEVIKFLHGETCLLPEKQKEFYGELENHSILYKLFQGYRKVRTAGKTDMYMGYWDDAKGGPSRVVRQTEHDLLEKFDANEPGYGPKDDSEWWKYVEAADIRPQPEMKDCPHCAMQNLTSADRCFSCGYIFVSKKCISCQADIAQSAAHCESCGKSQQPETETQWVCKSCLRRNPPEAFKCRRCELPRGVEDPLKLEFLSQNSILIEALSNRTISFRLPGDIDMTPLQLKVFSVKSGVFLMKGSIKVPAVVHNPAGSEMVVFLDKTHEIFNKYQARQEDIIAIEIAKWIWQINSGRITDDVRPLWALSNLYYLVHSEVWGKLVELDKDEVLREVGSFFDLMRDKLPELLGAEAALIYDDFDDNEKSRVMEALHTNGLMIQSQEKIESGEYLSYLPAGLVISIFKEYPNKFFDGLFWRDPYEKLNVPDPVLLQKIRKETMGKYHRCLEDMLCFSESRSPDVNYIRKINQTLKMVKEHLVGAQ